MLRVVGASKQKRDQIFFYHPAEDYNRLKMYRPYISSNAINVSPANVFIVV